MLHLFDYRYIIAIALSWVLAHLVKYLVAVSYGSNKSPKEYIFRSGGMPSSHSAIVVSMAALVGLEQGLGSAAFGVALALALVVVYDSTHVRFMAGEVTKAVNARVEDGQKEVRVHQGHTGLEAAVGSLLGACVALVVFFATQ